MILRRDFYARPTLDVARDLMGKILVHRSADGLAAGRIVEVEAYIGEDDPACHAAVGRTPRNAPLYGPPGRAYVYLNYGLHHLVNAVTEPDGDPAAVLIRALEPVDGLALMRRRRGTAPWRAGKAPVPDWALCRGPGNLTRALGITLEQNMVPLTRGPLTIVDDGAHCGTVACGSRIGISAGLDKAWRLVEAGNRCVSARALTRSAAPRSG
ncbi:MAG: DNA-3-methyladenine glycosylase [Vicinamibacterales bacterium]